MQYNGRYDAFDPSRIRTYPVAGRPNKVTLESLVYPEDVMGCEPAVDETVARQVDELAARIVEARKADRAVICFAGAHCHRSFIVQYRAGLWRLFRSRLRLCCLVLVDCCCIAANKT